MKQPSADRAPGAEASKVECLSVTCSLLLPTFSPSRTHKKLKTRLVDEPEAQTNDGKDDEVVAFESEHALSAFMEEDAEAAAVENEECAIFEFVSVEARRNFLEDWKMRTHGVVLAPDEAQRPAEWAGHEQGPDAPHTDARREAEAAHHVADGNMGPLDAYPHVSQDLLTHLKESFKRQCWECKYGAFVRQKNCWRVYWWMLGYGL